MGVVLDRLAFETDEKRFEVLKGFLLEDKGTVSYDQAAAQLGIDAALPFALACASACSAARFRRRHLRVLAAAIPGSADAQTTTVPW